MRQLIEHAASDYAVFMVTALLGLLLLAIYVFTQSDRKSDLSFPGLAPTDPESGNLGDVKKAGSFHEFLVAIHKKHGPIVSFWWGKQLAVSAASPELWKDLLPLFNRPVQQFLLFEPLIGKRSIQYANFAEGKKHRNLLDRCFGHSEMLHFIHQFNDVAKELCRNWSSSAKGEEHLPLRQHMLACALKSILRTSFGESLTAKEILKFEDAYETCWSEMERQLNGGTDADQETKKFADSLEFLREVSRRVLNARRASVAADDDKPLLIDRMLGDSTVYADDEALVDNIITNIIGGFHTTGNLLTWLFYYLAEHPDCEASLYDEIEKTTRHGDCTSMEDIAAMPYLRSVIDEAMRCSVLAPWAARFSEYDSVVGGHTIPKETPIILALGVVLQDSAIWPSPSQFDPSRFATQTANKKRHPLAFSPFGFAGKRKCPGYRFAYVESSVMVIQLLQEFRIRLVPGQNVEKVYGLVTQPKEEIWITVEQRHS